MPITASQIPQPEPESADLDVAADGFQRHRCTCRHNTVLGSHGFDSKGRYVYKIMVRDRLILVYFGAFTQRCRDCKRWTRIRMLPKEKTVHISELGADPETGT
jgi:hypothetical protein